MIFTHIDRIILDQHPGNLGEAFAHFFQNKDAVLNSSIGRHEVCDAFFYLVQEYLSKDPADVLWESHCQYIDVQLVWEGEERMEFADISLLTKIAEDPQKDFIGWEGSAAGSMVFGSGALAVFYPEDAHKPGLKAGSQGDSVRKIIYKVKVD